jgi:hypothetical protein
LLTAAQRSTRSRLAALSLHAKRDSREITAAARAVFNQRFYKLADPNGELSLEERERRAQLLRRAYFAGLALKSSRVRERRKRPAA